MYRLNVQVKAYWRQTVPDRGVVRSCDPLQNFWVSNHITGTAEPKVVKFCTRVRYINSSNSMTYRQQKMWLWSRDCFKILPFVVMQRVARVCQRQLSYLFIQICCSWQVFNWHSASLRPSAIAELPVNFAATGHQECTPTCSRCFFKSHELP